MPTLADLDAPKRSRSRDFVLAAVVALPLVGLFAWLLLPSFTGTVTGEAGEFDQRLRQEDAYMQRVCMEAMVIDRDETLCNCVLAVEFPSLDCRGPFLRWSMDRHTEACADPDTRARSGEFCGCVEEVAAETVTAGEDEKALRAVEAHAGRCVELPDAFPLPTVESIAPLPTPGEAAIAVPAPD